MKLMLFTDGPSENAAMFSLGRIKEIIDNLHISRATLYRYLRHRNIDIGTVRKTIAVPKQKTLKVRVHLIVENNNKFVRGKSRSRKDIESYIFSNYNMYKPDSKGYEYELTIPYENEKDLEDTIYEIISEASSTADLRNGFIEADVFPMECLDRSW